MFGRPEAPEKGQRGAKPWAGKEALTASGKEITDYSLLAPDHMIDEERSVDIEMIRISERNLKRIADKGMKCETDSQT